MALFETILTITTAEELDKLIATRRTGSESSYLEQTESSHFLVVKYWASECEPCKKIAPTFESMAKKHAGTVLFASVHWDDAKDLVRSQGIKQVPTFQFYRDGQRVAQISDSDPTKLANGMMEMLHGKLTPQCKESAAKRQKVVDSVLTNANE